MRYRVVRRTIWCGFWLSMPNSWASSSVGANIIVSASNWSISFGKFLKLRPVTLDAALQDTVPALLSLLDALPDESPFLTLDPPQRRQRTLAALKRLFLRESQVQP